MCKSIDSKKTRQIYRERTSIASDEDSTICSSRVENEIQRHRGRTKQEEDEVVILFLNFLLKFLKQTNQELYGQGRIVIVDCIVQNKRQNPGYQNLTGAMKCRLKDLVGEEFWDEAIDYFVSFVEFKMRHAVLLTKVPTNRRKPLQTFLENASS